MLGFGDSDTCGPVKFVHLFDALSLTGGSKAALLLGLCDCLIF
jgi:hypothetical protein